MRFSVSSAELKTALKVVSGAVPSKSTLPILECILFEQDGDALQLSATDLEISIVQRLPVQFGSNGTEKTDRVAVPAKRLIDTLNALPDLPISFSSNNEFHIELKTDQGQYKMIGYDGADYPAIPSFEGSQEIKTTTALVQRAIQKAGFAVSRDALRPAMMGIYFQVLPEQTEVVATDGHRLVRLQLDGITSPQPLRFIVPSKALNLASRVTVDGDCTLTVGSGYASFDFGDTTVLARLIDENYPNYQAVIPTDNDRKLTINREVMLAAVKRVALYSSSMTHQIRLSLRANEAEISAEDIERSSEAREVVLCEYDGEAMDIGFNSLYLTEVLTYADGEDVVFAFSSPNRAGVLTPAEQAEGEDMLMLIMPVMLTPSYA